jgi:hypothetical protein
MSPVFQMIFEPTADQFGLTFSEESDNFNQPVFVLPTTGNQNWWNESYYFPGELNGKYRDFELKFNNGLFIIADQDLKHSLRFDVGLNNFPPDMGYIPNGIIRSSYLKYVGNLQKFIYPFDSFLVINPLDLLIMDFLFREHKACFVGLTPTFGERRQNG